MIEEKVKGRWVICEPDRGLTWGLELDGDGFVSKIKDLIKENQDILEVGPGYGRIFDSFNKFKIKFNSYSVMDISQNVIEYIRNNYDKILVNLGDVEFIEFGNKFDVVISSLTFKHLHPNFGLAIRNLRNFMNDNGLIIFDLLEGNDNQSHFEPYNNYLKYYSKEDVVKLLKECGFDLQKFDYVYHKDNDEIYKRLLVFAKKI